jgi:hypothetical protein
VAGSTNELQPSPQSLKRRPPLLVCFCWPVQFAHSYFLMVNCLPHREEASFSMDPHHSLGAFGWWSKVCYPSESCMWGVRPAYNGMSPCIPRAPFTTHINGMHASAW